MQRPAEEPERPEFEVVGTVTLTLIKPKGVVMGVTGVSSYQAWRMMRVAMNRIENAPLF